MYLLNVILTLLTFVAYTLPFLTPKLFPLLSVFTLFMPVFFVLNGLFFLYWGFQFKKRMILSGVVLLIGITFFNKFYKFSSKEEESFNERDFTIMSYNVRLFNVFKWLERDDVPDNILTFINEKNPDIVCIQEYSQSGKIDLKVYRHRFIFTEGRQIMSAQAIFSKFPIINQGNIVFPNSNNGVIYADIKKGKDIIRVYNIHLQSLKISEDVLELDNNNMKNLNQNKSEKLFKSISLAFAKQQQQAELIKEHVKECSFPMIICGDMNNSAFSYVYRNIKGNLKDCFEELGQGFGATYKFRYYPARIDYIFADDKMKIKKFESFSDFENSDHYPIMAKLMLE